MSFGTLPASALQLEVFTKLLSGGTDLWKSPIAEEVATMRAGFDPDAGASNPVVALVSVGVPLTVMKDALAPLSDYGPRVMCGLPFRLMEEWVASYSTQMVGKQPLSQVMLSTANSIGRSLDSFGRTLPDGTNMLPFHTSWVHDIASTITGNHVTHEYGVENTVATYVHVRDNYPTLWTQYETRLATCASAILSYARNPLDTDEQFYDNVCAVFKAVANSSGLLATVTTLETTYPRYNNFIEFAVLMSLQVSREKWWFPDLPSLDHIRTYGDSASIAMSWGSHGIPGGDPDSTQGHYRISGPLLTDVMDEQAAKFPLPPVPTIPPLP